jgi:hypothetical protein
MQANIQNKVMARIINELTHLEAQVGFVVGAQANIMHQPGARSAPELTRI